MKRWHAVVVLILILVPGCRPQSTRAEGRFTANKSVALLGHFHECLIDAPIVAPTTEPLAIAGEERPAIFAHAPSTIRLNNVRIHGGSRLTAGIGLRGPYDGDVADGARFEVWIHGDGKGDPERVFDRVLNPYDDESDRQWVPVDVSLARFAGQTVAVDLRIDPCGNTVRDWTVWSNPVIRNAEWQGRCFNSVQVTDTVGVLSPLHFSCRGRVLIPPSASLEIRGRLYRNPKPSRPSSETMVSILVDGIKVRDIPVSICWQSYPLVESVDLEPFAGREVDIEITFSCPGDKSAAISWTSASVVSSRPLPRRPKGDPNLLLIVVDALRADHLGVYGYPRDTSPNLDAFAAHSLVFERALSSCSWTLPSVASILTGTSPFDHGVHEGQPLELSFTTIAERLLERGLSTMAISTNPIVGSPEGLDQGFEQFFHIPWAKAQHPNDLFFDWLSSYQDNQWFAYLHYIDPHDPYEPPASYDTFRRNYSSRLRDLAELERLWRHIAFGEGHESHSDEDVAFLKAAYDDEIRYWDSKFGDLIGRLEELGVLENTVVIVTSDHGEEFFEHGKMKHGFHLYEESIHVPLIIRGPGVMAGRHSSPVGSSLVSTAALGLTKRNYADFTIPVFERILSYTNHAQSEDDYEFIELGCVSEKQLKMIAQLNRDNRSEELYDLGSDRDELRNTAESNPATVQRLEEHLRAASEMGPTSQREADPGAIRLLKELGYVK